MQSFTTPYIEDIENAVYYDDVCGIWVVSISPTVLQASRD